MLRRICFGQDYGLGRFLVLSGNGGKILAVVIIDELVPECLAEDQQHRHRQKNADAGNHAFVIRACEVWPGCRHPRWTARFRFLHRIHQFLVSFATQRRWWLRFFVVRGMGFKKLELVLDDFSQRFFVLRGAQI